MMILLRFLETAVIRMKLCLALLVRTNKYERTNTLCTLAIPLIIPLIIASLIKVCISSTFNLT